MTTTSISPPHSLKESVIEKIHGCTVPDPFRWLEQENSIRTRDWVRLQAHYAKTYLQGLQNRDVLRTPVAKWLQEESVDWIEVTPTGFLYRRRTGGDEQFSIWCKDQNTDEDRLLVRPSQFTSHPNVAVWPLSVSYDGELLAFGVKQGGEDSQEVRIVRTSTGEILPDELSRGFLHGFAFDPRNIGYFYVHKTLSGADRPEAVYFHEFGQPSETDRNIFSAVSDEKVFLTVKCDHHYLLVQLVRISSLPVIEVYLKPFADGSPLKQIFKCHAPFSPLLCDGRIFALTTVGAPNGRVVELSQPKNGALSLKDVIPEKPSRINGVTITEHHVAVSYLSDLVSVISISDHEGNLLRELTFPETCSVRLLSGVSRSNSFLYQRESFSSPKRVFQYRLETAAEKEWHSPRPAPEISPNHNVSRVFYASRDNKRIPMYLVSRDELSKRNCGPVILTAYGGFGVTATPQFSVFVNILVESGCVFALPGVRGGSEFGAAWHEAGKRTARGNTIDDFICAAEWLIAEKITSPEQLGIFGGSNSGLLVASAVAQRPELFAVALCIAPLTDMLRYHLFDDASQWIEEFGTADKEEDFRVLHSYSPYHRVVDGRAYPPTMIVAGGKDTRCNPLHARKMLARLQTANTSQSSIILDYRAERGHCPVLPLTTRIEALVDRLAFFCTHLRLQPKVIQ